MLIRCSILVFTLFVAGNIATNHINFVIPNHLLECYNGPIRVKDNLLPMTMTTLIALVRKLENMQNTMSLSVAPQALLQRFRFDGIERDPKSSLPIPYGPSGREFYLYKTIFEKLLSPTQSTIDNSTFSLTERCTLHWMLSSSIDMWDRNDNDVCDTLQPYPTTFNSRKPRSVELNPKSEIYDLSDTEMAGNYQQQGNNFDFPFSNCPMENGVIFHKNGALNPGILLAGIAAGMAPEKIDLEIFSRIRGTLKPTPRGGSRGGPPNRRPSFGSSNPSDQKVDNTWGSTISGLLAELALVEGPTTEMEIGIEGGWNNTAIPKYYLLNDKKGYNIISKDGLTVARIRGALDGKLMAANIKNWNRNGNNLKLSQILEMFYADNGVFDDSMKACNRKIIYSNFINSEEMYQETYTMALALHNLIPMSQTLEESTISDLSQTVSSDLISYIPQLMDVPCDPNTINAMKSAPISDLHIVLDFSWNYVQISNIISILVDRIQFDYEGSNVTIINSNDGTIMMDSAVSVLDFYSNFTQDNYTKVSTGFDLYKSLKSLKFRFSDKLERLRLLGQDGEEMSHIILFIPSTSSAINDNDKSKIRTLLNDFNNTLPNVKILFLAPGTTDKFKPFVIDQNNDVISLGSGDNVNMKTLQQVLKRISEVPRSIINPFCGRLWNYNKNYNSMQKQMYIARNEIQYFMISANYFYNNAMAKITIQLQDTATLNVCQSRNSPNPGNATNARAINCTQLTSGNGLDIFVYSDLCSDVSYASQCKPVYISVASSTKSSSSNLLSCSDPNCRYPDMIKYTITHQGLTCYSGGKMLQYSLFSLIIIVVRQVIQNMSFK